MITAAVDGSALSNPGPAGWAWYIDEDHWDADGWERGTNNMGELQAVIELLEATPADEELHILCDSQYVINSVTKWMPGWKRKGWKKADGQPVLNQDQLKAIDEALVGRKVTFEWVKGHAGHEMNEAADERARNAASAYQQGTVPPRGPGYRRRAKKPSVTDAAPTPADAGDSEPLGDDLFSVSQEPAPTPHKTTQFDPDILTVIDQEKELLSDKGRNDKARVRALLHAEFTEFGPSGRIWTRPRLLAEIKPLPLRLGFEPIRAQKLADDVILLRWRATSPSASWLRSSVWQRVDGRWQLLFAQGSPVT